MSYKKVSFTWRSAEKPPKKSGNYLTICDDRCPGRVLEYSAKWDAWNSSDCLDKENAYKWAMRVDFWAPVPKMPEVCNA